MSEVSEFFATTRERGKIGASSLWHIYQEPGENDGYVICMKKLACNGTTEIPRGTLFTGGEYAHITASFGITLCYASRLSSEEAERRGAIQELYPHWRGTTEPVVNLFTIDEKTLYRRDQWNPNNWIQGYNFHWEPTNSVLADKTTAETLRLIGKQHPWCVLRFDGEFMATQVDAVGVIERRMVELMRCHGDLAQARQELLDECKSDVERDDVPSVLKMNALMAGLYSIFDVESINPVDLYLKMVDDGFIAIPNDFRLPGGHYQVVKSRMGYGVRDGEGNVLARKLNGRSEDVKGWQLGRWKRLSAVYHWATVDAASVEGLQRKEHDQSFMWMPEAEVLW